MNIMWETSPDVDMGIKHTLPSNFRMDKISSFLNYLKNLDHSLVYVGELPEEREKVAKIDLPPPLNNIHRLGIDSLYSHQVEAIREIRNGKNVVINTPNGSGKTLIYNISFAEKLLSQPEARSLYLFPTKALSQNQLKRVRSFFQKFNLPLSAEIYDGDTTAYRRKKIKEECPHILISNPDMLQMGILPFHSQWAKFLKEIRFIVLDELHQYRGIFGTHVAHILRRLLRILDYYGAKVQFIASSATINEPAVFANQITGLNFYPVLESGAPRNKRYFLFWNPKNSSWTESTKLLTSAIDFGLKTILFTKSRRATEIISSWIKVKSPEISDSISSYRAGYLPSERREIEDALFNNRLRGIIATNALELGIDVGDIDCCILLGYPGTVISTWQMTGRAGRKGEAVIILIASKDALDQYFLHHPKALLSRSCENVLINFSNESISKEHLVCASCEVPLCAKDEKFYTREAFSYVKDLEREGRLFLDKEGRRWFGREKYPQRRVNIRSIGENYHILDIVTSLQTPVRRNKRNKLQIAKKEVGTVDRTRLYRECHPGAIYLQRGREFEIISIEEERKIIWAREVNVDYWTQANVSEKIEVLKIEEEKRVGRCSIYLGEIEVTEEVTGFERRRKSDRTLIEKESLTLPATSFSTTSFWIEIPEEIRKGFWDKNFDFPGSLHAVEHGIIAIFPLNVPSDRSDLGGYTFPFHPQLKGSGIFIYDSYPGGVGLSKQGYRMAEDTLLATFNLIKDCPCEEGCPSCIQSPKCGNSNKPLDKSGSIFLLKNILQADEVHKTRHKVAAINRRCEEHFAAAQRRLRDEAIPVGGSGLPRPFGARNDPPGRLCASVSEKDDILFFDLETQKSAEDVGGWGNKNLMRLSVGVLYSQKEKSYSVYREDEANELINKLLSATLVVGFNVIDFDYHVLSYYSTIDFSSISTLDILKEVKRQIGFRLSLDHLARWTLKEGKIGNGLEAIRLFRANEFEKLTEYCKKDVDLTRQLYEFGKEHHYLLFHNNDGRLLRIPVHWI